MSGFPWESVVVGLVVAVAAAWAVVSLVRAVRKPEACSSCATSGMCPLANGETDGGCVHETGSAEPRRESVALH